MHYQVFYCLSLLLLHFCAGQNPADKNANAKTRATLTYIAGLSKQSIFNLYFYSLVFVRFIT